MVSGFGISEWPSFLSMARRNLTETKPVETAEVTPLDEATPRPWECTGALIVSNDARDVKPIALTGPYIPEGHWRERDRPEAEANAVLIVRAVNSYEATQTQLAALREALRAALNLLAAEAEQLEMWAIESRAGGWSTHQVGPMNKQAVMLRNQESKLRAALQLSEEESWWLK
jgi:hypothetical protein